MFIFEVWGKCGCCGKEARLRQSEKEGLWRICDPCLLWRAAEEGGGLTPPSPPIRAGVRINGLLL